MTSINEFSGIPASLADVALISAQTCAAAGDMSVSWWNEEVRSGRAPQPVMRGTRCTRWALASVVEFWRKRAEQTPENEAAAAKVQARAVKASARARQARVSSKAASASAL